MANNNKTNGDNATMTKQNLIASLLSLAIFLPVITHGYEVDTHEAITKAAVENSEIYQNNGQYLVDLGIDSPFNGQITNFNDGVFSRSIVGLFMFGARYEDEAFIFRPFNHFFDPSRQDGDQALHFGNIAQSNRYPNSLGLIESYTSPDWALEDNFLIEPGSSSTSSFKWYGEGQEYSWRDARQHFYQALTKQNASEKRVAIFAKACIWTPPVLQAKNHLWFF